MLIWKFVSVVPVDRVLRSISEQEFVGRDQVSSMLRAVVGELDPFEDYVSLVLFLRL
jgi:hypothetical protein